MKILSIKIKNLASIGDAFIDFTAEPLASTGVFGITGATGAGKSTLLDALCLALYGKTPRYNIARESGVELTDSSGSVISQGDVKSILMEGTASGFAEVTFAGMDKQIYRAKWQVKRAREKITGRLQADSIQLFNVSTNTPFGEKKTETLAEIEKVIGLNYDQFTRSVLLAQGDFTAFLKADKDNKASLLEKLTGTEIYSEISVAVFDKCREATQELKDLTRQMENVDILPEEGITELLQEKTRIEKDLKETATESKLTERDIQWYHTLQDLEKQKQSTEISVREAEENVKIHEPAKKDLFLVEEIQVLKPQLGQKSRIIAFISKRKIEKENQLINIGQLKEEIERANAFIYLNEEKLTSKKIQQKEYLPKFAEARTLDTLLQEKEKQVNHAQEQLDAVILRRAAQEKTLFETRKKTDEISGQVEEIENWCEKNAAGKLPAENISLIQSKLKDGENLLASISVENKKLEDSKKNLTIRNEQISDLRKEIEIKISSLGKVNEKIRELRKTIDGISLSDFSQKRDVLSGQIALHVEALSLWKQLFAEKENHKKGFEKRKELFLQLEDSERELPIQTTLLNEARIKKEYSHNILSKARLQLANNVKSLRGQLVEGEECPVCGSLEHPFALHNPPLDAMMEDLEKEAQNCIQEHEHLLQKKSALEASIKNLHTQSEDAKQENNLKTAFIHSLQAEWEKLPLEKECLDLSDETINSWLENKINLAGKEIKKLKEDIDFYTETKSQLEKEEEHKKGVDRQLNELEKLIANTEWEIKSDEKNRLHAEEFSQKYDARLNDIFKELNPFFSKADWTEKWISKPTEFIERLSQFSQKWVNKIEQLKISVEKINALKVQLEEMEKQFREVESETAKKSRELISISEDKSTFQNKRLALFEGKDVDEAEEQLREELEKLTQKNEKEKQVLLDFKNKLLSSETQCNSLTKTMQEEESELENINEFIQKWLSDYNEKNSYKLTPDILGNLAARDPDWIKEQREFFQKLNESLVEARSVFQSQNKMLANHQMANKPKKLLEELHEKFTRLKQNSENFHQRKGKIGLILEQQKINKERFDSITALLEKNRRESENWNKLSDLIGSPDGKKFRRIAQEYTLDILLVHANHHLEFLSRRYVLSRVPDTLALQITDRDMGDEIRTVFSLSGGESFLVSLALALGLASLSSDKMQVESLFIDEGFGSLDPETLDMAMDALDRLHSQGRKVGVISHVQEMKERITTQIQVEKMSSGKSRVVVVS